MGVKLIGRGAVAKGWKLRGGLVEIYGSGRYFTVTGHTYGSGGRK